MKKIERVMLIDDDPDTNFYNEIIIKQVDLCENIIVFQSAMKALNYLENENERVDLILLDINMPVMNGWQFLEEYENLDADKKARIIVIMLTSSVNTDDKLRAERYKAVKKYISKPISPDILKEVVELFE